jgi:tripartite-type tricarboxylate transporter receptor subunit TctC
VQAAVGALAKVVMFRGTAPAIASVVGARTDLLCDQATNTAPYIRDGRVRAYAVTGRERLPGLPDLPTTAEAGFPAIAMEAWHGLFAPAGTPEPAQEAIAAALRGALREERLRARFAELLTEPASEERATPAFHRRFLVEEVERWRPVIQAVGAYAD